MSKNEILIIDGVEYSLWSPRKEDELEKSAKYHSKNIFGPDSVYFDVKKKIATSVGLQTVPDAYLIDFTNKKFYLIEIELSSHPEYDHINKQIGRFIGALESHKTRQKIARILKDYIDKDIVRQKFVSDKIGRRELYQFFLEDILENVKEQNYQIIIIIDKITERISEACNILNPRPKIIEFTTFVRKNIGDLRVHCHLFKPLFSGKTEKEKVIQQVHRGYTGKEPEKAKLFNETFEVKTWSELLITVAEKLLKHNQEAFNKLADSEIMKGDVRTYLSKNKNIVKKPYQLSNGLFIELNLSANSIVRIIKKRLLKGCGYKETDIEIFVID